MEDIEKLALQDAQDSLLTFSMVMDRNYESNWHLEILTEKLEAVARGEIKRLMVFMPPRHSKSLTSSIHFPAWYLGKYPDKEIITSSYSAELAQDFGWKTREIVNDYIYSLIFPDVSLKEDSKSKGKWRTNHNGSYTAVGIGGAITGRGADILLIDDPIKNREEANSEVIRKKHWEWYTSTAYTRLEPNGAVILIMTRWHQDDLAGRILNNAKQNGEVWDIVQFPAIAEETEVHRKTGEALWNARYPIQALEDIKRTIGLFDFIALYQQHPIAQETQEFSNTWFSYYEEDDIKDKSFKVYVTVDLAISDKEQADNTAIYVVGKEEHLPEWYILDSNVGKLDPLQVIEYLFHLKQKYKHQLIKVGIESVGYQKAIEYFLREEQRKRQEYFNIVELKTGGRSKEARIRGLIPLYKAGVIKHRSGTLESELENELLSFPVGKHDDRIDALAYQLELIQKTAHSQRAYIPNQKPLSRPIQRKHHIPNFKR